ncbi:MAG TPA: DUF5675 family protein [Saprospiraceae bacterium]|nr:DUF5675 family protein [Saprospiraceae bacterium]
MESVYIKRTMPESKQTLGELLYNGKVLCKTLELPWLNNKRRESCIPTGTYEVIRRTSPKYGEHFHILNVPDRDAILIHNANYVRELKGCIAPGVNHTDIDGDGLRDVTSSKATMKLLLKVLPKTFKLVIS